MATANCTFTYERTLDKAHNESSATYHFGYGNAGQRWVTCYKVTVPSFTGNVSSFTISFTVNRGTAYPTNKTSTWKIGLDLRGPVYSSVSGDYDAGSVYTNGYYTNIGSYTNSFSGTITSSNSSFTSTFNSQGDTFDSGKTFYIYFFSGANSSNSIRLNSISGYVTYSTETITGTSLYVGTKTSPTSTYAYPTPSSKTLYWRIAGLQSPINQYTGFYLYKSSGFSFTNGQTSAPSGTQIASYSSTTNTAKDFTSSFTVPSSDFKIGTNNGVVAVARNASGYWRIGGSSNSPKVCYIQTKGVEWFSSVISYSLSSIGKTSATITVNHSASNNPKYANYVELSTELMSNSGTDTYKGTMSGYCTLNQASSSSSYTITTKTLNPGQSYTFYPVGYGASTYSYYKYYGLGGTVEFTTDGDYSGTCSSSVNSATSATITCKLNTIVNLDGYIYYSTKSGLSSKPITYVAYNSNDQISTSVSSPSSGSSKTYYFYVYSTVSKTLYQVGSTTFTLDQSSYTATITAGNITSNTATISISGLSSTTNLYNSWYVSKDDSSSPSILGTGSTRTSSINLTGLQEFAEHKLYAYVRSSASGKYYKVGSVTFNTHAYIYYADGDGNLIPCWTYMRDEGSGTLRRVLLNVSEYKQ